MTEVNQNLDKISSILPIFGIDKTSEYYEQCLHDILNIIRQTRQKILFKNLITDDEFHSNIQRLHEQ